MGEATAMVRTRGLTHIQLTVRDLARSRRFYSHVFGMTDLFEAGPRAAFLRTPDAHDVITLAERPESGDSVGTTGGIEHFGFMLCSADDLETALREAGEAGGEVLEQGERVAHGLREVFAFVADPDGYVIELFTRD
jgi:catechol 2,3-dioxygenase-like lactoylglutathione lyase family enzyme